MNGLGDSFLALPLIRHLSKLFGPDRVTVWANMIAQQTVFAELGSRCCPTLETGHNNALGREDLEFENLVRYLGRDGDICWISLNAYWPLSSVELHAIDKLDPLHVWSFFSSYDNIRSNGNGELLRMADAYFRIIGKQELPEAADRRPLVTDAARTLAKNFMQKTAIGGARLILLHVETADVGKQWPINKWQRLLERLPPDMAIVELGYTRQLGPKVLHGGDWQTQVALFERAVGFVGIDSCFAHIADTFDIPGVVLFGDSPSCFWRPRGPQMRLLQAPQNDLRRLSSTKVISHLLAAIGGA
jgi:hypothetical protein